MRASDIRGAMRAAIGDREAIPTLIEAAREYMKLLEAPHATQPGCVQHLRGFVTDREECISQDEDNPCQPGTLYVKGWPTS